MTGYSAKTRYKDEKIASEYDGVRFRTAQGKLTDIIERRAVYRLAAAFAVGSRILDLATGRGRFANLALDEGHTVTAADISAEMLSGTDNRLHGRNGFEGAVLCEAERLPFADNSFDAVTAIRFIAMLPHSARREALKEMRRVTRRWVLVNLPNSLSAGLPLTAVRSLRRRPQQYYPVSPWAFARELDDVGLRMIARCGPFLIPTRRLPRVLLGIARVANLLGEHSPLGYFSEQHFVLLEKRAPHVKP